MAKMRLLLNFFQFKRVNQQIFMLTIMMITIPLLIISVIIYMSSVESVKNEYQNSSNLVLNNLSFNFDQYLQSIENSTLSIQMDDTFQHALTNWSQSNSNATQSPNIQDANTIEYFMSTIGMSIKNVDNIRIYAGDHVFHSTLFNKSINFAENLENEAWYKQTLAAKGRVVLFSRHEPYDANGSRENVISISRVINKKGTRDQIGLLVIDIRLDSLRDILSLSEHHNRNFVVLDNNGGVIYASGDVQIKPTMTLGPGSQSLLNVLGRESGNFYAPIEGVNSFINFVASSYSDWTVIQYIDEKEMTKHAEILRKVMLLLAFISLGTAVLFMLILNARVTRPIIFLSKQVKKVGKGEFNVNLNSNRQDEFGVLYQGINKMVTDIQDYIERSAVLKAQQKLAQFSALKSQINPHFLANALESIQMKAIINDQRDISEMVGVLGQLFRMSIQSGKETVTLEEELVHTRLYVKVQQMRFGDKIDYIERLAPHTEALHLLHFSIQPLIENAIIHGLENQMEKGIIEISTKLTDDDMLIEVKDNGVGIADDQLEAIKVRLASPFNNLAEEHIGLKNVHDQIRFYFGDGYGIEIESKINVGTVVTIRIPIQ